MLIHKAARNGHLNVVEILINFGANVNSVDVDDCCPLYEGI
jgi:hypothetical protein